MAYELGFLSSNFFEKLLLKKNIKIATTAIIKLNQGDSSVFSLVKPS